MKEPLKYGRGDIMRFVKEFFKKRRRQKVTVIAALLIVYSIAAAGIFSYFHGSDQVSNRLSAENGSIDLTEPMWKRKGKYLAAALEPGMDIPKDPRAVNNVQSDMYVRLKLTVKFNRYQGNLESGDIPSNERRNREIFHSIMINEDNFIDDTEKELINWQCNNPDYVFVEHGQGLDNRETVFYFYYTAGDKNLSDEDVMHVVKPGESTSALFTSLKIPVYKYNYLGIFDQPYNIEVQAEAIPASGYTTAPKVDDVITDFLND